MNITHRKEKFYKCGKVRLYNSLRRYGFNNMKEVYFELGKDTQAFMDNHRNIGIRLVEFLILEKERLISLNLYDPKHRVEFLSDLH